MLSFKNRKAHFPFELKLEDDDDDYDDDDDVGSCTTGARRGGDGSGKHARFGLLDV